MERGIKEFERLFQEQADTIMRDATQRVGRSIVRLSPVAEGEFVAEWDVAINRPPIDTEQQPDPRKRITRARLDDVIDDVKYGDTVFFENTDPVAVRLEFGYSSKAPQGVVRLTARRWRSFVKGAGAAALSRVRKSLVFTE